MSKRALRCQRCSKRAVQIAAVAAHDGRPVYKCGACSHQYTDGRPEKSATVTVSRA